MGGSSPRPATTRPCGSGTRRPGSCSAHSEEATSAPSSAWPSAPMAAGWSRADVRRHRAGLGSDDRPGGRLQPPQGPQHRQITSVAYSPDGRWLASACYGSIVRVWDATTGKEVSNLSWRRHERGHGRGLQPRWAPARHGQLGGNRHGLGRRDRAGSSARSRATPAASPAWPSAPMGAGSPRRAGGSHQGLGLGACRRHTEPPLRQSGQSPHAQGPHRLGPSSRLQPRRDATRLGQRGWHDQGLGRAERSGSPHLRRSTVAFSPDGKWLASTKLG